MQDLLRDLNEEQLKAVTHRDGPLMIVAGAGTGKTTVITQRIAWLIEQGIAKPENILALTFTDKAAAEMEERVDMLLPLGYANLQISTFHSFCEQLLRQYGAEIGLSADFKLLNELDAWLLTRKDFDRFELDYFRPLGNPTRYLRALLTHFSRAKDSAVTPEDYLSFAEGKDADQDAKNSDDAADETRRLKELAGAYHTYQQILLENDSLDFGDLLMFTLKLLNERPRVVKELRERFTYVLVDEFQDTNFAQYEIVKLIAEPKNNLTVVGDDDQAIYKFRGASLANILQFQTDYPKATQIVLVKNYRSVQAILDQSHDFIQQNNPNRLEAQADGKLSKRLVSPREDKGIIEHIHSATIDDETEAVCAKIAALKSQNQELSWSDFAILVRGNDAAVPFVAAFERRGIPYQFLALRGLYTKPVILDLVSLLHVINNPYDSPSMYRVLNLPMYQLQHQTIATLAYTANRKGKSLFEACSLTRGFTDLNENAIAMVDRVVSDVNRLRLEAEKKKASELFVEAAKSIGYVEYVNTLSEREKQESFKLLQQFYDRMKRFEERSADATLKNFLDEYAHERSAGEEGNLNPDVEAGPDVVKIMTVHASKGLEFRYVFVVNLIDQRFPTRQRADAIPLPEGLVKERLPEGDWHLEEERRLFYVAMTRAKDGLFFTSADDYGGTRARKLSRFLFELGYEKPAASASWKQTIFEKEEVVLDQESELIIQIPKQFSFTQLAAFRTCPLQYKFAHILKIPVFGKWTYSFGKTMHNTLQRFFTVWQERKGAVQGDLFSKPQLPATGSELPVTVEELLSMYDDCWQDEWYIDDRQREKYRASGKKSLCDFYKLVATQPPKPLVLEAPFTLKIGDIVLKGRMDRIDKIDGGVEIIDYKTGTPKTQDKIEKADKEQLYLYQLAARDILGLKPVKLTYYYLEDNSSVSFLGDEDDLLDLQEGIQQRVAQIRQSKFVATPGFHCNYCDFADICEFRKT